MRKEKEAVALSGLLPVCSLEFYTWACSLTSGSWKFLGYLFKVASECRPFSVQGEWRRSTEAGRSAFSSWSLQRMGQKGKHVRYMECKTEHLGKFTASGHSFGFAGSYRNCDPRKGWNDKAEVKETGGRCPVWGTSCSLSLARWGKIHVEYFEPLAK